MKNNRGFSLLPVEVKKALRHAVLQMRKRGT
ncbi:hypothetical protein ABID00_004762 [Faecalicatena orotica]